MTNIKLSEDNVAVIKRCLNEGTSKTELAKIFNVSRDTIYAIKYKKVWRAVRAKEKNLLASIDVAYEKCCNTMSLGEKVAFIVGNV